MARVLLIILLLALTIYALADWIARSRVWTPGRLNRWVWLAVIVIIPVVGPLAWIITGLVTRAEERQRQRQPQQRPVETFRAPDDDPNRLADLAERISRRQKRSRPQFNWDEEADAPDKPGVSDPSEQDTEGPSEDDWDAETSDPDRPDSDGNRGPNSNA